MLFRSWTEDERESFVAAVDRLLAVSARIQEGEELPDAYEEDGETLLAACERIDPLLQQLRGQVSAGGMPDKATIEKLMSTCRSYTELVMHATLMDVYGQLGD